ncbi:MAG TPA: chemotaxis response regulator protein-glutamate methylesterase, partial [Eubacteriaceae bacterium]|nr:chemotaxis response regulator protein-glutamate methylesterase [Eubacteriaceae bacterium]
ETLKRIKRQYNIPVIMLSAYSKAGSDVTMEALKIGAIDFIEKTATMGDAGVENLKHELEAKLKIGDSSEKVEKIKPSSAGESKMKREAPSFQRPPAKTVATGKVDAVVIGASTGGPKVLFDLISKLPSPLTVPVFIVQHMPKGFTSSFAERLDKECPVKVMEATDNMPVQRGIVYVAPGDYHMRVENNKIKLDQGDKIHGVRPAVDYLFESAANKYGRNLLAVVLTGMGKDGTKGLVEIKKKGGVTIAQNEESCVVYGMPRSALEAGAVDEVMSPLEIAKNIKNSI